MGELFESWMSRLGATDRVPAGWQEAMDRHPHEHVLAAAGLDYVGKFEFSTDETWTVETRTGFVYSTSFLSRQALGDQAATFERELAELLRSHEPDGVFHRSSSYACQLSSKPS
jgi:hypothetical protein